MPECGRWADFDCCFKFVGRSRVIRFAQEHERQVRMNRSLFRIRLPRSHELLLRRLKIAAFEVGHAQIVTELRIPWPARNRLLAKQDRIAKLARVQLLQQLAARLSLSLILSLILRLRRGGRTQNAEKVGNSNNKQ